MLKLAVTISASFAAGLIGSWFTTPAIGDWYVNIERSSLTPPNWVFGPVWSLLYLLMGIAAWLVWQRGLKNAVVKTALVLFSVQLILNCLWSIFFFGWHQPGLALVDIVLLWISILLTIKYFAKISRIAAWLLIPYIMWVSFAAYLNYVIWTLN